LAYLIQIALVASVDALSQMMSSRSTNDCARIDSIAAARYRSPLNTGSPMLTRGRPFILFVSMSVRKSRLAPCNRGRRKSRVQKIELPKPRILSRPAFLAGWNRQVLPAQLTGAEVRRPLRGEGLVTIDRSPVAYYPWSRLEILFDIPRMPVAEGRVCAPAVKQASHCASEAAPSACRTDLSGSRLAFGASLGRSPLIMHAPPLPRPLIAATQLMPGAVWVGADRSDA
jgi:hypothetical protein